MTEAVISVGKGGRGFLIKYEYYRLVITAARCLPKIPAPHPWPLPPREHLPHARGFNRSTTVLRFTP
jgi:hypothetical protein